MGNMYRYYFLLRPPAPGTHPRGATKVVSFDQKEFVQEIEREAWGYVEYGKPISNSDDWDLVHGWAMQ